MYNETQIIGFIGREPELRYTADGKASCTFSVATNRKLGQGQTETTWFKVTTWEKTAEYVSKNAHKGMTVHVVGRLVPDKAGGPRVYQKQDGTYTATFEIVAREFHIVDFKGQDNGQQGQYQSRQQARPQNVQPVQRQAQQAQEYQDDIPW